MGAVGLVMIAATAWYSANAEKKARLVAITNTFADALKAEADGQKDAVGSAIENVVSNDKLQASAAKLKLTNTDLAGIIRGDVVPAWENIVR